MAELQKTLNTLAGTTNLDAQGAAWAVLAEVGAGVFDTGAIQTITRG